jgi:hypothetical protein
VCLNCKLDGAILVPEEQSPLDERSSSAAPKHAQRVEGNATPKMSTVGWSDWLGAL